MSSSSEKLFEEFPPVSTAEWERSIAKDLKGRDPKTLIWRTEDGIDVKPFYRAEDAAQIAIPDAPAAGRSWHVGSEAETQTALEYALERGAQAVIVPSALASSVPVDQVSLHVRGGVQDVSGVAAHASGSFNVDPVADLSVPQALEHYNEVRATYPGMAPFVVDAARFHNSAASVTQELAFAMASGAECIAELAEANVRAEDVAGQIIFSFGIGANYFFEIAKFRAARLLWRQIAAAFDSGVKADARIHAHTSKWNKTAYDPHVNLLRTTTEAMSAVIGGCEMLNVGAFDEVFRAQNGFSQRLAINIQLILRDEAHFAAAGDPGSGSWYIDSLTDQVARTAWKIFQEIEAAGGMRKAIAAGLIDRKIADSRAKRDAAVATRKRPFVGVNQYPNPNEQPPLELIENGLRNSRGAFPFEAIRLATDRYVARGGSRPVVFLARFGDVKFRRARAEFAANYFACSGFAILDSYGFNSADEAVAAIQQSKPSLVVLCSSDPEYTALAAVICPRVSQPVIVAGYPKEHVDSLKSAGVADFIYLGSNAVEVLSRWQKKLAVAS